MAERSRLTQHIESFVDISRSATQQAASLDAIASLLRNDVLTFETLVREMEMYLTTTDNSIRTRGILLLAELLTRLAAKTLNNATIHSLIGFFSDRLADWKALRGALVGCLALLRRKNSAGVVTDSDARAVAQSYLQNLQVQSLGQHDRKLCFELLGCLLDRFPNVASEMGDDIIYGICEAIDGEKDPQCLMLTFHIVEVLARIFPDPMGPLANFAGDLFDLLGCYFPIHFTHPKSEDINVKRDDLSRALMLAFSSTPLFEPFAIPLLLEKLSSALPLAKVDSLKYLNYCTLKYGADRMAKHADTIWSSLNDAIHSSQEEPISYLSSEFLDGMHCQHNEIAKEALILLWKVISQNSQLFTSLIVADEDITNIISSISSFKIYCDIPLENKLKLHAVGRILYASARASVASCNKVFENFFPWIMDSMRLSVSNPSGVFSSIDDSMCSEKHNFGALYICIELLEACRDLVSSSGEFTSRTVSAHETWSSMMHDYSPSLTRAFSSTLVSSLNKGIQDADIYAGVRGLQILAAFPGEFSPVPKSTFEDILKTLTSTVTSQQNNTFLSGQALKALTSIGSFLQLQIFNESEKTLSYMGIVVERMVSLLSPDDLSVNVPLQLEAICDIGTTGLNSMMRVVQGLEDAISVNLHNVYARDDVMSTGVLTQLLECYSVKVLPWFHKNALSEELLLRFAVNILNHIENSMSCNKVLGNELLDATMMALKLVFGSCSEESQSKILEKAYAILLSSTSSSMTESMSATVPSQLKSLQLTQDLDIFSGKNEGLISLFAAVIMAARPQTHIPNVRVVTHIFMKALLKGHVPSAQALGSMVNKLPLKINEVEISGDCTLEEVLDIIFKMNISGSHYKSPLRGCEFADHSELGIMNLSLRVIERSSLAVHAINGLAWIGKGLIMRGHERAKDIVMMFLNSLVLNGEMEAFPLNQDSLGNGSDMDMHHLRMKSAADCFHILMSDSEVCLNRRFHASIRPLYKQRLFSVVMPILLSSITKSNSSIARYMLYRASGHLISNTPLLVILTEAKKLIHIILDGLLMLSENVLDKDVLYGLLLVLSGILTDKNGQEVVAGNAHIIINCLTELVSYPHLMLVRETAVQCLAALSTLPHTRIYPMRTQVLRAISKAIDDPKRTVRQEAVRCRQAWAAIASRSLHF